MSARLVPVIRHAAPVIPLERPVQLIGRHVDCDVRINLLKISRRHCCVALAYDRVLIRDLGSRNGLRVNGVVVEEARLHPGDEVAIGPIIYRVEVDAAAPRPAPPASKPTPAKPPEMPASGADSDDDLVPLADR